MERKWPPRLLSNPNGPLRQEQTLLQELRPKNNAKQAAALLSTMSSRQQANDPALRSAASDFLKERWIPALLLLRNAGMG